MAAKLLFASLALSCWLAVASSQCADQSSLCRLVASQCSAFASVCPRTCGQCGGTTTTTTTRATTTRAGQTTTTTRRAATTTTTRAAQTTTTTQAPSSGGVSAAESTILSCHNAYRSSLAKGTARNISGLMPAGQNIARMSYDSGVAATAQQWANRCTMQHSGADDLGENLYMSSDASLSPAEAMQQACDAWWSELVENGVQSSLVLDSAQFNKGIGHWSQMAWASTTQLGCAVASCPNSQWKTYVVCNYSPPGNFLGQTIYQRGTACGGCGASASCDSASGLCVPN